MKSFVTKVFKCSIYFPIFNAEKLQMCASLCDAHMPGFAPAIITIRRAMRLCRFHFSMEAARQMTPIRRSVVSLQYSAATLINTHTDNTKTAL